jgi:hypothetical protein
MRVSPVMVSLFAVLSVGWVPAVASAQSPEPSHWGVSFSATPKWEMADQLKELIEEDNAVVDITGSEFTIGVVRGSQFGGDWGVSFVRKPFKDGSSVVTVEQDCFQSTCLTSTESLIMEGVKLTGVEVHWFWRMVNIKQRVQIGLNIAGGIANVSGTIIETTDDFNVTFFNPQTGQITATPRRTVETHDAAEELVERFPLAKLEAMGSIIVAPGLKLKVAGGLNFPAYSFRVGLVYLIGAR